jgi:hypothetical protein
MFWVFTTISLTLHSARIHTHTRTHAHTHTHARAWDWINMQPLDGTDSVNDVF